MVTFLLLILCVVGYWLVTKQLKAKAVLKSKLSALVNIRKVFKPALRFYLTGSAQETLAGPVINSHTAFMRLEQVAQTCTCKEVAGLAHEMLYLLPHYNATEHARHVDHVEGLLERLASWIESSHYPAGAPGSVAAENDYQELLADIARKVTQLKKRYQANVIMTNDRMKFTR